MGEALEGENYEVVRGAGPLVFSCEHAARALPPDLGDLGIPPEVLDSHWGWDRWALDVLSRFAPAAAATTVAARLSRLVLDVNRGPDEPTLVRDHAEVPLSGNHGLLPAQVAARVARFHAPYHAALDRELARVVAAQGRERVTYVAFHSFTGRFGAQDRAFDVGLLFDAHEPLVERVRAALAARGLRVRLNEPYSGMRGEIYAAARHGRAHGVAYFEVELNQDVLEDEAARVRVAEDFRALIAADALAPGA